MKTVLADMAQLVQLCVLLLSLPLPLSSSMPQCMPSIRNESKLECWEVDPPIKYYITQYGVVTGEQAIMNEIFKRG